MAGKQVSEHTFTGSVHGRKDGRDRGKGRRREMIPQQTQLLLSQEAG